MKPEERAQKFADARKYLGWAENDQKRPAEEQPTGFAVILRTPNTGNVSFVDAMDGNFLASLGAAARLYREAHGVNFHSTRPEECLGDLGEALEKLRLAIDDAGPAPDYHYRAINDLRATWPTLYRALMRVLEIHELQRLPTTVGT